MADEPAAALRPLAESDLDMLLAWRNHPQVRMSMFQPQEIAPDAHRQWFARASVDPQRHLYVFEDGGRPCGYMAFTIGAHDRVADWGFYAAPLAPRGTGSAMGRCALDLAFGTLGLHKVCGQALASNPRSVAFHRRLGFAHEGTLREHHWIGGAFIDVLQFGLLAREWRPAASA